MKPFISLLVYVLPRPESYLCIGAGWENKGRRNGKHKQVNKGGEKARHCDLISPPAGYSVSDYVSLWHIVWNPQLISYRSCVPFLREFSWVWEEPCSMHQSENSISSLSGGMYSFFLSLSSATLVLWKTTRPRGAYLAHLCVSCLSQSHFQSCGTGSESNESERGREIRGCVSVTTVTSTANSE